MHKITDKQATLLYHTLHGKENRADAALLRGIFAEVWATRDGEHLVYRTVFLRAARLAQGIAEKKPFSTHNLQMAALCALTLLDLNGHTVPPTEENVKGILSYLGKENGTEELAEWLESAF